MRSGPRALDPAWSTACRKDGGKAMSVLFCDRENQLRGLMYLPLAGHRLEIAANPYDFQGKLVTVWVDAIELTLSCRHFETV